MNSLSKKDIKREKIIDAAFKLFAANDFHDVMIEDVAKSAGIAKGTIYSYFTSKEDLYFSIIRMRLEVLVESLKAKIDAEESFHLKLHSFVTHLYMFMVKYNAFYLIYKKEYLKENFELCNKIKVLEEELYILFVNIIKNYVEQNNLQLIVNLSIGCIYSGVDRAVKEKLHDDELVDERNSIYYYILRGLRITAPNPLQNKTIVISRDEKKKSEEINKLEVLGAEVIPIACFDIKTNYTLPEETAELLKHKFDYIIFTSVNAVNSLIDLLKFFEINIDFSKSVIASVGKKTSDELNRRGIKVSITPEKFTSAGLTERLLKENLSGKKILFPASSLTANGMLEALTNAGAEVISFIAYHNEFPSTETVQINLNKLQNKKPDAFIFTSPSSFNNFLQIFKNNVNPFGSGVITAIGPATLESIESAGFKAQIVPEVHTLNGVINSLIKFYNN